MDLVQIGEYRRRLTLFRIVKQEGVQGYIYGSSSSLQIVSLKNTLNLYLTILFLSCLRVLRGVVRYSLWRVWLYWV